MRIMGNAPTALTSLVGRDGVVRDVRSRLGHSRLVTLTGPGGVGKTRVALQVAREAWRVYADGVWLVELAALRDPALLESTFEAAIGDRETQALNHDLPARLEAWEALLVVDNCEHLLDACGELLHRILVRALGVRVLATSREDLRISGEQVVTIGPLPVPREPADPGSVAAAEEHLRACESVQLLLERARAIHPYFDLTPANMSDTADLCRRLEGVPLSIELAAARLRTMGVRQLLDKLDQPCRVLSGGPRDVPHRHRRVEDTIDWSYQLCSPAEQRLWARMSVFAGSVDAEAIERVCDSADLAPHHIDDVLDGLVRKSVVVCEPGDVPRFRLLDAIRHYGRRYVTLEAAAELSERHARYYEQLVRDVVAAWFTADQLPQGRKLVRALPNLRAVLDHVIRGDDPERSLRLVSDLQTLWMCQGRLREGDLWFARAISTSVPTCASLPSALADHGWIQLVLGQEDAARASLTRSIELAELNGDTKSRDRATALVAAADAFVGRFDDAVAGCKAALAGRRAAGDTATTAFHLMLLGEIMWARGDAAGALTFAHESETLCAQAGETWCRAFALWVRALAHCSAGEYERTIEAGRRSLAMKRSLDDTAGVLLACEVLSWALAGNGQWSDAGLVHAAVRPRWSATCKPLLGFSRLMTQSSWWAERIRCELGDDGHARVEESAARMGLDDVVRVALGVPRAPGDGGPPTSPPRHAGMSSAHLTRRETEVAELLGKGLSNREIATQLVIAVRTAETHVERIMSKLGFTRRTQVALWWRGIHDRSASSP